MIVAHTLLQIVWFFLIFVLIAGYFILDGFDLGAGVLSPFVAKNDKERAIVRRSIGPVWDGNEVWLITAGGALFAAFPAAYATTFSGFYLAVMLVLFGLILRAVALEFRAHDNAWGKFWDIAFVVGSLLPALLFGVAVGNVVAGIPLDANGDYAGIPLLGLITPFTLLCGLLGLAMMLSAGAAWIALKAPKPSELQERAAGMRRPLQLVTLALFALVSLANSWLVKPVIDPTMFPLCVVFAVLVIVAIAVSFVMASKDNDLLAFVAQSTAAFFLVALLATTLFPNLVVAAPGSVGESITLMNGSASALSLAWMAGITAIGVPLVLVYHVIIYRTFRGRIKDEDLQH